MSYTTQLDLKGLDLTQQIEQLLQAFDSLKLNDEILVHNDVENTGLLMLLNENRTEQFSWRSASETAEDYQVALRKTKEKKQAFAACCGCNCGK